MELRWSASRPVLFAAWNITFVTFKLEGEWIQRAVWVLWIRENALLLLRIEPLTLSVAARTAVTVLTDLSRALGLCCRHYNILWSEYSFKFPNCVIFCTPFCI